MQPALYNKLHAMAHLQISTPFNIDLEFETAPVLRRVNAYFIDLFILCCYLYLMKYVLYRIAGLSEEENRGLDILLIAMPMLFYSLLCEVRMHGQSVGKRAMQLRVVSLSGGEPTFSQYLLRWITRFFEWPFMFGFIVLTDAHLLGYIFTTCFFGLAVLIVITVTKKQQRIGDLAAGTAVIDTRRKYGVDDSIFVPIENPDYQVMFPEVMRLTDNDINTIKSVLVQTQKEPESILIYRLDSKVKTVLSINSSMPPQAFLQKLMEDYNFLATRNG